ncbi:MAG: glycoside hydrolase family 140 protein [Kiritimatiellae bacterium]|nr:glycoside hydrolase family 140 protein [Kiritimatiellia bacterium]
MANDSHGTGLPRLKVSANRRHIVTEDGRPFFWLGDTGWELIHRLNREDATLYLENRAAKGFTVIQAVIVSEWGGLEVPNAYGQCPFRRNDPTQPDERYFEHVDFIVDRAASLGLYTGLLPTWGDKVSKYWGEGPEIFNPKNARVYGEFLGRRYRDKPVVWISGGDRDPRGYEPTWIALARGLRKGDGGAHLITGHWAAKEKRMSTDFFNDQDWLDVNMAYSGHRWIFPTYELIGAGYRNKPVRPVLDPEPLYENHPYISAEGVAYHQRKKQWDGITRAGAFQIRLGAYWAMLAGACGHTYGCSDIWQFYDPAYRKAQYFSNVPWQTAIHFEGSYNMGVMRKLFESRPWQTLIPDPAMVARGQRRGEAHIQAARARDKTFAMAYFPWGVPAWIDLSSFSGRRMVAHWFHPRLGTWEKIGSFQAKGVKRFVPSVPEPQADRVLVIDDESRGFPVTEISIPGVPRTVLEQWPY